LAVLVGSIASMWQLRRAARAAERERVVREFVTEVLAAGDRKSAALHAAIARASFERQPTSRVGTRRLISKSLQR
jgi:hypothetical protein